MKWHTYRIVMSLNLKHKGASFQKDNISPILLSKEQLQAAQSKIIEGLDSNDPDYTDICTVYDIISDIKDPEFQLTLEELGIVSLDNISINRLQSLHKLVTIWWLPTVAHCSYASQIGLAMRMKLKKEMPNLSQFKFVILIQKGKHLQEESSIQRNNFS